MRTRALLALAALALLWPMASARATQAYGTLNNFDVVNDTGSPCHGFEIELEGVHSSEISYTYDWNHYGVPKIREDNSNPASPRCFVRYESGKNPDGSWAAYTAVPSGPIAPTDGHMFTDPTVNFGGEHFGVGFLSNPTNVMYFWLIDDGSGNLVRGNQVIIATPAFTYYPPVPAINVPAQVQAVIELPAPPDPPVKEFGDPCWVKEIRTTSHNNNPVELADLVTDDPDDPDDSSWENGEPAEVEIEWRLMQTEFNAADGGANGELAGEAQELPDGDEIVTRRWEFFKYIGPIDEETGEAKCDEVGPDDIHGVGIKVINGVEVDLSTVAVVGDYIGAQMSGFDQELQLGLIDHLQDGELGLPYPDRLVVIGGTPPISTTVTGTLPAGMDFDEVTGILSGTPAEEGIFVATVHSTDAAGGDATKTYSLNVLGEPLPVQRTLTIDVVPPEGGDAIGAGVYDDGALVTIEAIAHPGYVFLYWVYLGAPVSTDPVVQFPIDGDYAVEAHFAPAFTVTTAAAPPSGGTTTGDGAYLPGDTATVDATPHAGYDFLNWTLVDAIVSTLALYSFPVDADVDLVANFQLRSYAIAVSAAPAGAGSASGGGAYNHGDLVTVTATPAVGYRFVNWTEGGVPVSATASYAFAATANRTLVANFTRITYTIGVSASPAAGGAVSGGGVYNHGQSVTVNAAPNAGYRFVNWTEGGAAVSAAASYTFTASANRTLVANFATITYTIGVSASPAAGGTVSGGGVYASGASVTVNAAPNAGYHFVNWTEGGAAVSAAASYTFTAGADRTLVANFARITYTVGATAAPPEGGTASGGGVYGSGDLVTLSAAANAGFDFLNWMLAGSIVSSASVYSFSAGADVNLVANFLVRSYAISASASPAEGGTASGGGVYDHGSSVTVTAAAAAGYAFAGWTEGGAIVSTSEAYTFTAGADRDLVAVFELVAYTIGTSASPADGGTVSGGGVYDHGSSVTVTASAAPGYAFAGWTEGGAIVSTSEAYTFTAGADRDLVAVFEAIPPTTYAINASASPAAGGSVSGGGVYVDGETVTLSAAAHAGYAFAGWFEGGTLASASAVYSFIAAADRNLVAVFEAIPPTTYTIAASASPAAGGSVAGGGVYAEGGSVTLTATANAGYVFAAWVEDGTVVSIAPAYSFVASADRDLVAVFEAVSGEGTIAALAVFSPVLGGLKTYGVVSLSAPAPAGGVVVQLASSNAAALQPPATVAIPAGKTRASFTATAGRVRSLTRATVTATLGSSQKSKSVLVIPFLR